MKDKLSLSLNCIASFLMSICVLWCLSSSFDIEVSSFAVLISILLFTSVLSAISIFSSDKKQFRISLALICCVYVFLGLLLSQTVISQTNYVVNSILLPYSKSFPVPSGIFFSRIIDDNATIFFVVLGFLLSLVNTISLVRAKRLIPCTILCVLCLVPCFMLVINPPDIIPITVFITILVSLYITAFFRKISFNMHGSVFIVVASFVLIFTIVVYSFIPIKNYKRFDWQDNLLDTVENLISFGGSATSVYPDSIDKTQKLDEIGPIEYKGIKKLEVKAENGGDIYLKGVAYANYNENEWSTLTDEQAESFPENFDAYNITKGGMIENVSILTENKSDIIYTAYDLIDVSVDFTPVYDVTINNDNQAQSYDLKCYADWHNYKLDTPEYDEYVDKIYTQLPESTKEKMLEIAKEYKLDQLPIFYIPSLVKDFISKQGYYSLNTEKMPDGEDFPVWFINEAESGYCVHYATAATVMLRALGIPARYVTGYYVNAKENNWTEVTSDNAHAWVEYYDKTRGWVVLEATPSSFEPVSNTREDIETIPKTEPTKPNRVETTPKATNGGYNKPDNVTEKPKATPIPIIIVLILPAVISFIVRYRIYKNAIAKHFYKGKNNTRAIYIYRYIEKIRKLSHNVTPDDIIEIANKARFSNHRINDDEIKMMLSFVKDERKEFYRNCNKLKGLYYKYIVVI